MVGFFSMQNVALGHHLKAFSVGPPHFSLLSPSINDPMETEAHSIMGMVGKKSLCYSKNAKCP